MLNRILAYAIFNVKSLLKDKVSFIWSIVLPLIMFWIDSDGIVHEKDLTYWWVYMTLCSYIYGIGLYALEVRETGSLKTIFSINHSSVEFFFGNLVTQIIFCLISIGMFDFIVLFVKDFSVWRVIFYSISIIILCIPFAFLGYGFTLLKSVHANTMGTIFSIILFGLFMLLGTDSVFNKYNPIFYISQMFIQWSTSNIALYIVIALVSVGLGVLGIVKFESSSIERR